ncbi:MAG TPA: DNA adenine methylase [Thermoanaerobaculia bacterium]|nr:DNA adenine methylase [Thermoanaerobaculia bacterium]
MRPSALQMSLALAEPPVQKIVFPERARAYPRLRYMGSKHKLLPWIWETLAGLEFDSALDLFSGTGSVAYLMKAMNKRVVANDFLNFAQNLAAATIANSDARLDDTQVAQLCRTRRDRGTFIEKTFTGIFFEPADLRFLDVFWSNLDELPGPECRAIALASVTRACLKRQPRGVFTVNGGNYDDGRRDLRLSLQEHFVESVAVFNDLVFDNGRLNRALRGDAFEAPADVADLVYMDPPYVPRADDNCYIKRYHFLEGLASYWREPGTEILETSRVKKIAKRFTPFSYRSTAADAFDRMFRRFAENTLVLSYSSNGYPDLETLVALMRRYKHQVDVVRREHRYHFGTHAGVADARKVVAEYLIIGRE